MKGSSQPLLFTSKGMRWFRSLAQEKINLTSDVGQS